MWRAGKDDALARIVRRQFEHRAAAHPTHGDAVVEVDGARVGAADHRPLLAGLRVDQQLGLDRHVQAIEHRNQIAGRGIERQGCRALLDVAGERRDRVVQRRVQVIDRLIVERSDEGILALSGGRCVETTAAA
jgi:hypothetical protein